MAANAPAAPFVKCPGGIRVRLRLTPKASANALNGIMTDGEGGALIKAAVTTVPEGGKANASLIKMLSKEWKVAKSAFQIIHGATDRNKTVFVAGNTEHLLKMLQHWASDKLGNE